MSAYYLPFIVIPDAGIDNPIFMQVVFNLKKGIRVHLVSRVKSFFDPRPDDLFKIHTFQILGIIKRIPIPFHTAKHIAFPQLPQS